MFAERLEARCALEVREAVHGDEVSRGRVLIAPGGFHMTVAWTGQSYHVALNQKPPVHHCRPAVDVLFASAANCPDGKIVAAILTGMGCDGTLGMQRLKSIGARTLAQDESTCVVYGMPRAAIESGAVDQIVPLPEMASAILRCVHLPAPNREGPQSERFVRPEDAGTMPTTVSVDHRAFR